MSEHQNVVTDIALFPIKSCQAATVNGEKPTVLQVGPTGFEAYDVRDRDFVLVDAEPEADGQLRFISQRGWGETGRLAYRQDRQMATFETDISEQGLLVRSKIGELLLDGRYLENEHRQDIRIHSSKLPQAFDMGAAPAMYFSELFERPVRLFRANRAEARLLKPVYRRADASNQVAGADGFPFLLINQVSVDACHEANGLAPGTVPTDRYRYNVLMSGAGEAPFAEDYTRKLRIGNLTAYAVKACGRCPIPNIDQQTGDIAGGGLKILRQRKGYIDDPSDENVFMGQNLNHILKPGREVRIGDEVHVIEASSERNFTILSA